MFGLGKIFSDDSKVFFGEVGTALSSPSSFSTSQALTGVEVLGGLGCVGALYVALLVVFSKGLHFLTPRFMRPARAIFEKNNISFYEVVGVTTCFVGLLLLSAVSAATSDDALDSAAFAIAAVVAFSIALILFSLSTLLLFALSPASRGEALVRLALADAQNILLGFLRVALC